MRGSVGIATLVLIGLAGALQAESAAVGLFVEGNESYRRSEYERARAKYLEAVATGVRDSRLFYNLGNACFKSERLGEAIVWYERARRLSPRDDDIRANLLFASYVKKDRVEDEGEPNPLWQLVLRLYYYPTENELAAAFACFLFGLFGQAAMRLRRRQEGRGGLWLGAFASICCLTAATALLLLARVHQMSNRIDAVVTVAQATARSGPDIDQTVVFVIHEGTTTRLQRREGDWVLIRLANGLGGWMRADEVTVI